MEAGARGNFGRKVSGNGGAFNIRDASSTIAVADLIDEYDATLNTDNAN